MRHLPLVILLLSTALGLKAQVADSLVEMPVGQWAGRDTVYLLRTDTLRLVRTDTLYIQRTDTLRVRYEDTAALSALREKERFYREILSTNGVDKEKLEAERNHYIHLVDSLRTLVRIAELENVRREEANKYLEERARIAEAQVATATNRKKKVRPIQGVAMRFYRTPAWEIRINGNNDRYIANRNAGHVEFDYVTGASVMLWDMTRYFNRSHNIGRDSSSRRIPQFDQSFAYDLGLYIGFGGSNLFKNFYVGASFRFVDFFYLIAGMNIAEYQVLADGYNAGEVLHTGQSIDDITAKAWQLKPFIALSIDLDFLSYIKK